MTKPNFCTACIKDFSLFLIVFSLAFFIIKRMKIAFISAQWHDNIVSQARRGFEAELVRQGLDFEIADFTVPGSLEIPLLCKKLVKAGGYNAIVAAGFIVDGNIYRHEFVASTVIDEMIRVSVDHEKPIFSVVLTAKDFDGSDERIKFFEDHFVLKGQEAAQSCVAMLDTLEKL